jgi:hypothetical protein
MSKPYIPQPGTIPARAIEYLKVQPPGSWMASAVICEAIGHDRKIGLGQIMARATAAGAVKHERHINGMTYWQLGDGVPVERPKIVGETDDAPIVQRVVPASAFHGVNMDSVYLNAVRPPAEPAPQPAPKTGRTGPSRVAFVRETTPGIDPWPGPCMPAQLIDRLPIEAVPQPAPQPAPAPAEPRFAVWSDGVLQIEDGAAVIRLQPEAAQQLRRFLAAMPGSEA